MRQMGPATLRSDRHMAQERGEAGQRGDKGLADCAAAAGGQVNSSGGSSRAADALTIQAMPYCLGGLRAGKRGQGHQTNT